MGWLVGVAVVGGRREGLRDGGRCGGGVVVMCE